MISDNINDIPLHLSLNLRNWLVLIIGTFFQIGATSVKLRSYVKSYAKFVRYSTYIKILFVQSLITANRKSKITFFSNNKKLYSILIEFFLLENIASNFQYLCLNNDATLLHSFFSFMQRINESIMLLIIHL